MKHTKRKYNKTYRKKRKSHKKTKKIFIIKKQKKTRKQKGGLWKFNQTEVYPSIDSFILNDCINRLITNTDRDKKCKKTISMFNTEKMNKEDYIKYKQIIGEYNKEILKLLEKEWRTLKNTTQNTYDREFYDKMNKTVDAYEFLKNNGYIELLDKIYKKSPLLNYKIEKIGTVLIFDYVTSLYTKNKKEELIQLLKVINPYTYLKIINPNEYVKSTHSKKSLIERNITFNPTFNNYNYYVNICNWVYQSNFELYKLNTPTDLCELFNNFKIINCISNTDGEDTDFPYSSDCVIFEESSERYKNSQCWDLQITSQVTTTNIDEKHSYYYNLYGESFVRTTYRVFIISPNYFFDSSTCRNQSYDEPNNFEIALDTPTYKCYLNIFLKKINELYIEKNNKVNFYELCFSIVNTPTKKYSEEDILSYLSSLDNYCYKTESNNNILFKRYSFTEQNTINDLENILDSVNVNSSVIIKLFVNHFNVDVKNNPTIIPRLVEFYDYVFDLLLSKYYLLKNCQRSISTIFDKVLVDFSGMCERTHNIRNFDKKIQVSSHSGLFSHYVSSESEYFPSIRLQLANLLVTPDDKFDTLTKNSIFRFIKKYIPNFEVSQQNKRIYEIIGIDYENNDFDMSGFDNYRTTTNNPQYSEFSYQMHLLNFQICDTSSYTYYICNFNLMRNFSDSSGDMRLAKYGISVQILVYDMSTNTPTFYNLILWDNQFNQYFFTNQNVSNYIYRDYGEAFTDGFLLPIFSSLKTNENEEVEEFASSLRQEINSRDSTSTTPRTTMAQYNIPFRFRGDSLESNDSTITLG
jgi:hypothetical protein